jgi:DNA/RNA-binding domain of Phe-tRNA-synthetase-like protein
MTAVKLLVSKELVDKGIEVTMATFAGANIVNKIAALERFKKEKVEKIAAYDLSDNQILAEYARLQREAGIASPTPPAQWIIEITKRNRRLPNINSVVDCYNVVSAETYLSIGAHDLDHIRGNVRFVVTRGGEKYTPLGAKEKEEVKAGEYACMDDEKILCRLDLKQCDETKITKDTRSFMLYVQGNRCAPMDLLKSALQDVCHNITTFCGGTFEIVKEEIV